MVSTCPSSSLTSVPLAPVSALATAPLPDVLAPAMPDPVAAPAAPARARFRRLVVFDGRLA